MTPADIIQRLETLLPSAIVSKKLDAVDPWVALDLGQFHATMQRLRDEPEFDFSILNCVSGVDYLEPDAKKAPKAGFEPHLEVVYHLSSFRHRHRLTVKLILPRWKNDQPGQLPEVPTVCDLWRTADWHEREVFDLCGVQFLGHPDLQRILLAEDWEGYPLRKDYVYPQEYHGIRCR
ncbi:NADH-quinone oxidoreductase subunit C [Tuwongella immobilis]|uniref:NADH-quinone oxidoreductase subunit C n=1 Tax=Tuwongella immobilis TaxID=692036 RepID=A0A6C2YLQ1_9BACT|nr:NADH-quinone oxidoreductase subunit C [Tuwongella immobilis]VIP02053.1 nadh dehydrogenase : NADH-quinone oxidoreductase subunit C OS=uncultured planctomycete GN=nuoC PE=3 SV=1: Complex1_30kDa [Tuwongella immobilis]VTS00246.1 nadh dehydrogenase : NADH-quinone oxidoreductase subunit C OS=uncultured planctomycete GN=nuoC PE=3 SV=1: Complex1_30kDa [Tuwongella immobilis]